MDRNEIEVKLRESLGKAVTITFGGHTEKVSISSVDSDGFVCYMLSASPGDKSMEFWIPFDEVTSVTES